MPLTLPSEGEDVVEAVFDEERFRGVLLIKMSKVEY